EGEVTGVRQQLLRLHEPIDLVFKGLVVLLGAGRGERHRQRRRGASALARVRFVDHDREAPPAVLAPDLVEDERELLHRGDDDLLPLGDELAQVARVLGVADGGADLRELFDGVTDLLVENTTVGNDDDRVEDRHAILREADELVRQPRDRVRLAAARRVLDQVALAGAVLARVGEQPAHHVELVEARPDLHRLFPAGLVVLRLDDLRVVLEDVGEALAREDPLPEVVGLQTVRVGRIAGAVVPALGEGQEPRALAPEVRAEANLVLVHGEVHDAAAELEELLARVAVSLVLLDRVLHRLLGQAVLQLEGGDRQAIDEEPQVERPLRLVTAVAELPGDAEAVGGVALGGLHVAGRRRAVEEVEVVRPVFEPLTQHVDGAAPADLPLKTSQELAPRRPVPAEVEGVGHLRLRLAEEGRKLGEVHAVLAVVVLGMPADPSSAVGGRALADGLDLDRPRIAGRTGQGRTDQPFKATLGGIGGHVSASSIISSASPTPASSASPSASVSSSGSGSSISSGSRAAASRTSSLPVTTSAIRRVRYSRRRSHSRDARRMASDRPEVDASRW